VKDKKPPAPVRGIKPSDTGDEGDEEEGGDEEEAAVADLVPRNDVG